MARNRRIFQSSELFIGPVSGNCQNLLPATGSHYSNGANGGQPLVSGLYRIQNISHRLNLARTDVNQFGELAAIDRIILEQPTVSLDFSYLQNSLYNEKLLGFTISNGTLVSCISGFLTTTTDEKNYFIKIHPEGQDVMLNNLTGTTVYVGGIGNGFVTSYRAEGSVGNFPRASVTVEGLNVKYDNGSIGNTIPSVNPVDGTAISTYTYAITGAIPSSPGSITTSVLRPGDIVINMGTYAGSSSEIGVDTSDWKVQSYNLGFDLSRTNLSKLGSKYAFAKTPTFPVQVNGGFTANIGDTRTGQMVNLINDDAAFDMTVKIYNANTTVRNDANVAIAYTLKNVKVDSIEFAETIGDNANCTMNFSTQIASSSSTDKGLMISGVN